MYKKRYLKILSLFIFFIVLTFCKTSNATNGSNLNGEQHLIQHNLETGETSIKEYESFNDGINKTKPYIPTEISIANDIDNGGISTQAITGNDDRDFVSNTSKYPFNTVCYIEANFSDGTQKKGSGFIIYKNLVLTACHVFWNGTSFATSAVVYPARNASTSPYGSASVKHITHDGAYQANGDFKEDWACLTLNSDIGYKTGYLGIAYSEDYSYFQNGEKVTAIGYPTKVRNEVVSKKMYQTVGNVRYSLDSRIMGFEGDISEGMSGGPVLDSKLYAIGIITGDAYFNNNLWNYSNNINKARFDTFRSLMK